MARIAGINIPPNQHAEIGLTAIYGIGRPRAREIFGKRLVLKKSKKVKDLTDAELERIRDAISKLTVEGDLRREIQLSIKRHYRLRHLQRHASSPRSARSRSAHSYECTHSQGSKESWRRSQKVR